MMTLLQSLVYNASTRVPVMSCNLLATTIAHLGLLDLRSQGKLQMQSDAQVLAAGPHKTKCDAEEAHGSA